MPSSATLPDMKRAAVVATKEKQAPSEADHRDDGTTGSYAELVDECERCKAVAKRGTSGREALESAFKYRSPSDKRCCRIPKYGFGKNIYNDAQWFRLVYDNGRLPEDMRFVTDDIQGANKRQRGSDQKGWRNIKSGEFV